MLPRSGGLRKYHYAMGLTMVFVTLTFAGDGAFHAWRKLRPDERLRFRHSPAIVTADQVKEVVGGSKTPRSSLVMDFLRKSLRSYPAGLAEALKMD